MAGMLPPFVPPSARVAIENLPLITEFVVDRVERSFASSFSIGDTAEGGVATLPSIEEFVLEGVGEGRAEPAAETTEDAQFIQRTSRSPSGTYEARHQVSGGGEVAQTAPAAATPEPDLLLDRRAALSGAKGAIVNEVAEPAAAWEASAPSTAASMAASAPSTAASMAASMAASTVAEVTGPTEDASDGSGSSADQASSSTPTESPGTPAAAPEVWVSEERDSFDWQAAAHLAVPPAEAQRAADEWSATEWDRSNGSVQDHVAAMLAQVSRRVRSGDLEVHGSKQMGSEAALVAALSALLAEATKK